MAHTYSECAYCCSVQPKRKYASLRRRKCHGGILAGHPGVISAMRSAAREAVNAAKKGLKIKSPSQVFRDEVGTMVMRGFGMGVLKESKEQAKVIRNASRFLTGEAREGSIVTKSSDNRKTYNNNVSSNIQAQQMVVRDEHDVRSLAV